MCRPTVVSSFFFFNDTATTEIYTLSLHDALPISRPVVADEKRRAPAILQGADFDAGFGRLRGELPRVSDEVHHRSEEHTSELQSPDHLVCRLLLEKKKTT